MSSKLYKEIIMKENNQLLSSTEMRKNLITGAIAGSMLGLVFGYGFGSLWPGLLVGVSFGLAIGFRLSRFTPKMRYPLYMTRRMVLSGSLALLAVFGFALMQDYSLNQTQMILIALIPIAAITLFVVAMATAIASLDELQRRIQTEAISLGFAGTIIICAGYSLLQLAGILPALNWGFVIFVMVFMVLAGKMWTLWRYR
jgi:hypothetical protein